MGTKTASTGPKKSSADSDDAGESLVKKHKTKTNPNESIYDQDEMEQIQQHSNDHDDFIEAPLQHDHMLTSQDVADLPYPLGSILLSLQKCYYSIRNTAKRTQYKIYGDAFPWDDFVRTIVLSSTLFIMIGGYWLLRSLKDPVLTALCGVSSIPKAKMLSVFVVLGVVAVYNHLLDEESGFRKEQVCPYIYFIKIAFIDVIGLCLY